MKKQVSTLLMGILIGALLFGSVAYASNINVALGGIKVFVGGFQKQPQQSPFIYNGTTYVPLRFIGDALGEPVEWDGKTKSVYIGGRPEGSILTDIITPFTGGEVNEKFVLGNDTFAKTINVANDVGFNLKGKFKRFTAQAYRSGYGQLKIIGDGKIIWEYKFNEGELPVNVDLDISGIENLTFTGPLHNDHRYFLNPVVCP